MSDDTEITVGQKLWFVSSRRSRPPGWATVKTVGRKWLTLDLYRSPRVHRTTLEVEDFGGRCYLTAEEHEADKRRKQAKVDRERAWDAIRGHVSGHYRCPDGLTEDAIRRAGELLGMTGEAKP